MPMNRVAWNMEFVTTAGNGLRFAQSFDFIKRTTTECDNQRRQSYLYFGLTNPIGVSPSIFGGARQLVFVTATR